GAAEAGQWGELTTADWLASYQLNVLSASRMIDAWLPGMKQQGWGRILQLGTLGTDRPGGSMPHYYAAKGALLTLTLGLAQSLPASGITVNILSPGLILTPEVEASFRRRAQRQGWDGDWSQIEARSVQERHPNLIGRIARRDEVADLALFLVSERASFITGQNIRIDGGALLCSASTTQGQV
ncbi:MAG TPA: SDR family oxidoreductase, partial [Pseudomonadales bacterium]|nr:SDR family oxidoreductase [Pseudomonadales bacterium]